MPEKASVTMQSCTCWEEISRSGVPLSAAFLLHFNKKLNWELLSQHYKFNVQELGMFINLIDWHLISKHLPLTNEMLAIYKNFLDWNMISKYQKLLQYQILQYKDVINWDLIFERNDISNEFKEANYNEFINFWKRRYATGEIPKLEVYLHPHSINNDVKMDKH